MKLLLQLLKRNKESSRTPKKENGEAIQISRTISCGNHFPALYHVQAPGKWKNY
jgi:hypothetical protein